MTGYIHSVESFGTVDGPGVRFVVFTQGCPMRCQYCHNPDTWTLNTGTEMETDDILAQYDKNRNFYKAGGLTVTGGEPLMQLEFVTELFEKATKNGIHTCLDTSGITFHEHDPKYLEKLDRLFKVTSLILLDIKHVDSTAHKSLTGHGNESILLFAKYLEKKKVPMWVRHVLVPTITDNQQALYDLGYFMGDLNNLKAIDVLPYHTMGKVKYEKLGMEYPLKDLPNCTKEKALWARSIIMSGLRKRRQEITK